MTNVCIQIGKMLKSLKENIVTYKESYPGVYITRHMLFK